MSTKNTTTSTNQYNSQSMGQYNKLQNQYGGLLSQYMNNPMGAVSGIYDQSGQMAQQNAAQLGQSGMSNLANNQAASGFGGTNMPAYMQSQIAAQGRATSGMQSNAFLQNNLAKNQAALGVQQFGASQAGMYRPLQTGGTQTKQTGGLGSWLPQVAGGALGMAMAGMTGGASGGAGMMGGFGQSPNTNPSPNNVTSNSGSLGFWG